MTNNPTVSDQWCFITKNSFGDSNDIPLVKKYQWLRKMGLPETSTIMMENVEEDTRIYYSERASFWDNYDR